MKRQAPLDRRAFLVAGLGAAAIGGAARRAEAAEWTAAEKANVQIVNDFCAAWSSHDVAKIMASFADASTYRMTETAEPVKGRDAITARVKTFVDRVTRFEVLDTYAKGPMVVNERIDHFSGGPIRSWRGVGVFFLKDGNIVEWHDYTISMDRT
jgi:limonene-1,2-epoxide hydrolase